VDSTAVQRTIDRLLGVGLNIEQQLSTTNQHTTPKLSEVAIGVLGVIAFVFLIPYSFKLTGLIDTTPILHIWISFSCLISTLAWMLFYPLWVNKKNRYPSYFRPTRPKLFLLECMIALLGSVGKPPILFLIAGSVG